MPQQFYARPRNLPSNRRSLAAWLSQDPSDPRIQSEAPKIPVKAISDYIKGSRDKIAAYDTLFRSVIPNEKLKQLPELKQYIEAQVASAPATPLTTQTALVRPPHTPQRSIPLVDLMAQSGAAVNRPSTPDVSPIIASQPSTPSWSDDDDAQSNSTTDDDNSDLWAWATADTPNTSASNAAREAQTAGADPIEAALSAAADALSGSTTFSSPMMPALGSPISPGGYAMPDDSPGAPQLPGSAASSPFKAGLFGRRLPFSPISASNQAEVRRELDALAFLGKQP